MLQNPVKYYKCHTGHVDNLFEIKLLPSLKKVIMFKHFNSRPYQFHTLLCREEADELCRTLEDNEDKSRAASEMADVLYHSMVLLARKEVQMEEVLQILRERFSRSGIEEKKSRKSQS